MGVEVLLGAALLPPWPGWRGGGGTEAAPSSKGLLEVFTPSLAPYKWEKGIPEHLLLGIHPQHRPAGMVPHPRGGDDRGASRSACVAAGGFSSPVFSGGGRRGSSVLTDPASLPPVAQV